MQTPKTDNVWLKADNWQEVLEDPGSLPSEIRDFLEFQNQTTESWLGGQDSRQWSIDELKSSIRDRDDSVPVEDGKYTYWQRFVEQAEHPDFYAKKIKVITKFCSAAMSEQPTIRTIASERLIIPQIMNYSPLPKIDRVLNAMP